MAPPSSLVLPENLSGGSLFRLRNCSLRYACFCRQERLLPENKAIKDLRSNQNLVILPADKGNATVLLNRTDYRDKMLSLLADEATYSRLKKDTTLKIQRELQKLLTDVFQGSTHVQHSEDFINKIRDFTPDDQEVLVSFDVVSLFTSVPIRLAAETCTAALDDDPTLPERTPFDVPDLKRLLLFCLENTYFTFEGTFYSSWSSWDQMGRKCYFHVHDDCYMGRALPPPAAGAFVAV
ncbi:uncharacterized protein LOC142583607 [Dermacentor variabilis]|uniref:uncharacterized protein LOC142583607 n=1 Tax=Dermacentor variabilis TaxID=34621 RepID=UPI003F5C5E28